MNLLPASLRNPPEPKDPWDHGLNLDVWQHEDADGWADALADVIKDEPDEVFEVMQSVMVGELAGGKQVKRLTDRMQKRLEGEVSRGAAWVATWLSRFED